MRITFPAAWIGFVSSVAAAIAFYMLLPTFGGVPLSTQRIVALILAGCAIGGGGAVIVLLSARDLTSETRHRNLSSWSSVLGPLGAVQFFSGLALLFWATHFTALTRVTAAIAATCLLSSALLNLLRGAKDYLKE